MRVIGICILFLMAAACTGPKVRQVDKPNVILILTDDQGYGDIAALGNPWIKTPNIDKLYAQSVRFTNYHVCPTCAPTRSSLMTGHHNNRAGVWHTINGRSLLLERELTMADIFKQNGYRTAIFGKWHLGDNYPFRPQDRGFDEVLVHGGGGVSQTMDYWDNHYFDDTYMHNGKPEKFEGYCTDVWFENAKRFIKEQKGKPFFCYLSTNAAHSPYFVADKYSAPYKDNPDIPNAAFYGMIANIDENIGKLIEFLRENNCLDNTILVFSTDNGTAAGVKVDSQNPDGFVVKGFNAGMRGLKASMYEGGHRVPLFIHWKNGGIATGKDVDELTAVYDVLPTLADLCGLRVPDSVRFDGQSLVPLIHNDNSAFKDRFVVVNSQRCETPQSWRRTSVMQGKWRLVNENELYNLENDPEQRNNVAAQFPEKVEAFKTVYQKWWSELEPTYNDQPYFIVGSQAENPTTLFCHDWHTKIFSPWQQNHIRTGYLDNGYWLIRVAEPGMYSFKLRRWPKETGLPLNGVAPQRPAIPGTSVTASKPSKVLVIKKARISVQGIEQEKPVNPEAQYAEFRLQLEKGETKLQTWFTLDNNDELGAYYVEIEKM